MNLLLFRGRPAQVRGVHPCAHAACPNTVRPGRLSCALHTSDEQFFAQLGGTPDFRFRVLRGLWRPFQEGARA